MSILNGNILHKRLNDSDYALYTPKDGQFVLRSSDLKMKTKVGACQAEIQLSVLQNICQTGNCMLWRDNVVWDSGNDGLGSGLDADLLDGMQSSIVMSPNTIVARDSSNMIYANICGNANTLGGSTKEEIASGAIDWSSTVNYDATKAQLVQYNGVIYQCIQTGTNFPPSSYPAYWHPLIQSNHSAWLVISTSGETISSYYTGYSIQLALPANGIVYLPLISSVKQAQGFTIVNTTVYDVTITATGIDGILNGDTTNSFVLRGKSTLNIIAGTVEWFPIQSSPMESGFGFRDSNVQITTTPHMLTYKEAGSLLHVNLSSDGTIYLPKADTVPDGTTYWLFNPGSNGIHTGCVNVQSGDDFHPFTNPYVQLNKGDSLVVTRANTTQWAAIINQTYLPTVSTSGWTKLPGGVIMQWGETDPFTTNNSSRTITYPITFPNSVFFASPLGTLGTISSNSSEGLGTYGTPTISNFVIYSGWGSGTLTNSKIYWIAIGY